MHWKHLTCTAAFSPSTPTEAGSAKWKFLEFFKGQPFSSPAHWGTNLLWDHAVGQRANVNWGEPFQQQKQPILTVHCIPSAGKYWRGNIKAWMNEVQLRKSFYFTLTSCLNICWDKSSKSYLIVSFLSLIYRSTFLFSVSIRVALNDLQFKTIFWTVKLGLVLMLNSSTALNKTP